MPDRKEVEAEIQRAKAQVPEHAARLKAVRALHGYTGRHTLLYGSAFTSLKRYDNQIPPALFSIDSNDLQGVMASLKGTSVDKLDIILHSPGGSPDAAEQIVNYLRLKFSHIRAIIPQNAMSAATMIACAANEILVARHSALGPIDPQMLIRRRDGTVHIASAHSILEEFRQAKKEISEKPNLAALWVPRIVDYPPGIFEHCSVAAKDAQDRVCQWLESYMFKSKRNRANISRKIGKWLADAAHHKAHGKPLGFQALRDHGMQVGLIEDEPDLQDLVMTVFHTMSLTFDQTDVVKIIESQDGNGIRTQVNRR